MTKITKQDLDRVYVYTFRIMPSDGRFAPAVRQLLARHSILEEVQFTEPEFVTYRKAIFEDGFKLVEITRKPHQEPERIP